LVYTLALIPVTSMAQDYDAAGAAIRAGDYAAAHRVVEEQLADHPEDVVLLRIKAVALMESGNDAHAIQVLKHALSLEPASVACRYYLAQTYAYQGSIVDALGVLNEIVQMAPDSEYARLAEGIIPDLQQMVSTEALVSDQRRWNVYLRTGMEYDDNVPARAQDDPSDSPTESWRFVGSLYGEVRPLDQRIDRVPVTLGLGYSFYQTLHERDGFSDYDVQSQNGSVYLSRSGLVGSRYYSLRLGGDYNWTDVGNSSYSEIGGADASLDLQLLPWLILTPKYRWENKEFEEDGEYPEFFSRDGEEQTVGVAAQFYLCNNRLVLTAEYDYRWADTEGSLFDLQSQNASGSANLALPWRCRLYTSVSYQQEDYDEYVPNPQRLDDVWTFYTALSRPVLGENLWAEVNYTRRSAQSNLSYADYRQNVYGMALSYNL
jgi:tetratricopeptide (TPR) repeat protein